MLVSPFEFLKSILELWNQGNKERSVVFDLSAIRP
jgi:hypothetical protein